MSSKAPPRRASEARPVASWLDAESGYRALAARVDLLVALQARLAKACPGVPLTVAGLDERTLTLTTPNAAWAGRLRQMAPTLLEQVRESSAQVERIRIVPQRRVDLAVSRAPMVRAALPAPALAGLARLTSEVQSPALRSALERLVQRQRPRR